MGKIQRRETDVQRTKQNVEKQMAENKVNENGKKRNVQHPLSFPLGFSNASNHPMEAMLSFCRLVASSSFGHSCKSFKSLHNASSTCPTISSANTQLLLGGDRRLEWPGNVKPMLSSPFDKMTFCPFPHSQCSPKCFVHPAPFLSNSENGRKRAETGQAFSLLFFLRKAALFPFPIGLCAPEAHSFGWGPPGLFPTP